ncbi:MAG TPA: DUF962 domain-containing protein [Rhizomicrobium sp.]|jgi:hypothetical protein|nr:DUF962 domain-containing protein [Rhizomicrobium sp.]
MTTERLTNRKMRTYAEFWPYYLQEHAKPQTRALHYIGTGIVIAALAALMLTGSLWFLLVAMTAGYAFAWIGHFFVEHNRPATFTYPLWSLISDFRMTWDWVTGSLPAELKRAGVE